MKNKYTEYLCVGGRQYGKTIKQINQLISENNNLKEENGKLKDLLAKIKDLNTMQYLRDDIFKEYLSEILKGDTDDL